MRTDIIARTALGIFLSFMVAACSAEPREYDFGVSVTGGPKGWPVWVNRVKFDGSWVVGAGAISCGGVTIGSGSVIVGS